MAFLKSAIVVALLLFPPQQAALGKNVGQLDGSKIVADLITSVVRPGFADLQRSAAHMSEQLQSHCAGPSVTGLVQVRQAFDALVLGWGRIEFIRLGPLSVQNRLERLLFWPDRRGRGLKQVRDIIRLKDEAALDPDLLANKSVAVQGLLALEFALFGDDSDAELATTDSYRCAYASAVAESVLQLAGEVTNSWQVTGEGSISDFWLNPAPQNALFRDEAEQFSAVLDLVGDGLEIVLRQRLDPFLRDDLASARPKSALFWRSGNTVPSLRANLDGFGAILKSADLEHYVDGNDRRMISSLNFELENAKRAVSDMDASPDAIVAEEEIYNQLNYMRIVTDSMLTMTRDAISPIFGLSSGFSSLDGD